MQIRRQSQPYINRLVQKGPERSAKLSLLFRLITQQDIIDLSGRDDPAQTLFTSE